MSALVSGTLVNTYASLRPSAVSIVAGVCTSVVITILFGTVPGAIAGMLVGVVSCVIVGGKYTAFSGAAVGLFTPVFIDRASPEIIAQWFMFCIFAIFFEFFVYWIAQKYRAQKLVTESS